MTRSGKGDYFLKFKKMMEKPPTSLGRPSNPSPSKMKKVWKTA